jgi:hypothetical protein
MVAEHDPHLVVIGVRGEHDSGEIGPCLGGTALELLTRFEQPLHAPQLVVIGKRHPQSPLVRRSMMDGVGFRIACHAPVDVLIVP